MEQPYLDGTTKEQHALEFIKSHEPMEGYFLGFSGGKDSVVLYDLAQRAGVRFTAYYSLMPDPPELIKFIRAYYSDVNILRPEFSFWAGVANIFPPHRFGRWCCRVIKEQPSSKVPLTYRLLGVRAEESKARAKHGKINRRTKYRINLHPMFGWLEWEVWEYIKVHNLPYCSLYDEGFGRLGCVVCPVRSAPEKTAWKKRWPKQHKLFEKQCRKWWNVRGEDRQKERGETTNFAEFMNQWYNQ